MWTLGSDNPLTQDPYIIDTINKLLETPSEFRRVAITMWGALGGIQSKQCRDLLVVPLDALAALEIALTGTDSWSAYIPSIKLLDLDPFACLADEVPNVLEEVTKLRDLCLPDAICASVIKEEYPPLYELARPFETHRSHFADALRMFSMMSVAGIGASFRNNCLIFDFLMTSFLDVYPYWTYAPPEMARKITGFLKRASDDRSRAVNALEHILSLDTARDSAKAMMHEYILLCVYELLNPATVQAMEMGLLYVNIRLVILATEKSVREQDALIALWEETPTPPKTPTKKKKKTSHAATKKKKKQLPEATKPENPVHPPEPEQEKEPEEVPRTPWTSPTTLPRHPKYKTEVCYYFSRTGVCTYGDSCIFKHGTHRIPVYAFSSFTSY